MEAADVDLASLSQSHFGTWKRFIRRYVKQLIAGGLLQSEAVGHMRNFTDQKELRALADKAWGDNDEDITEDYLSEPTMRAHLRKVLMDNPAPVRELHQMVTRGERKEQDSRRWQSASAMTMAGTGH